MKYLSVISILILCSLYTALAQNPNQRLKIYRTWVLTNNESPKVKGVLYDLQDSSILVSNSRSAKDYPINNFEVEKLYIKNIQVIKVRRKNNIGKSALIGTVAGFVAGGLIGFASGDTPPCSSGSWFCFRWTAGEKAIFSGIGSGILGGGIGALIGLVKVKIPINGNMDTYNVNKGKLVKYSIVK